MKLPEPALVYWNHIDILHPEYRKVTGYTYHGAEHWKPPLGTQLPIHEFGRAIEAVLTENQHTK